MKKLLVLLVSAALVLSLAAVTMAAASVSGSVLAKYQFGDDCNDPFDDVSDEFEAAITATGNVTDSVVGSITFKSDGNINDNHFFVDAYTFKATFDWGTWTVGKWGYAVKGPVLDVLGPVYDDFKATAAMAFETKLDSGFNAGLWLSPAADDVAEDVGQGAFVINLGYTCDAFFASAAYVNTGDNVDNDGFALNLGYTGIENLILYTNYEDSDGVDEASAIIGAKYTMDAFYAMAEFQLNDDFKKDNWGLRFHYDFSNKISGEYRYVSEDSSDVTDELRIGYSF